MRGVQVQIRKSKAGLIVSFWLPAAIIVALDQITKQIFWHNAENYSLIEGFFRITLVRNAGAAFGMFQGARYPFIIASVIAAAFIVYLAVKLPREERVRRVVLGMILGGAIGNLIDRIYAGEVIDFLEIGVSGHYWPVFNVADMGVSIGAVLLLILLIRQPDSPETAPADEAVADEPAG